jgi:hypothetical protein
VEVKMSRKKQQETKPQQLKTDQNRPKSEFSLNVTTSVSPSPSGKKLQVKIQLLKNGEVVAEDYDFVII